MKPLDCPSVLCAACCCVCACACLSGARVLCALLGSTLFTQTRSHHARTPHHNPHNSFANRIPLLFEGGSDVVTKTAMKRINWANYKINAASDKVGVFVSIVSTKVCGPCVCVW